MAYLSHKQYPQLSDVWGETRGWGRDNPPQYRGPACHSYPYPTCTLLPPAVRYTNWFLCIKSQSNFILGILRDKTIDKKFISQLIINNITPSVDQNYRLKSLGQQQINSYFKGKRTGRNVSNISFVNRKI